ncbi:hypothetical protein SAMN04488072_10250 [Lentibacillus halodurans]|uniref:Uncharacterized protein n=1 Tax=Lentibacillus halodurans TaxID=237679 RepID=A0A1I0VY37_9BACI|nr:hypothetical protein SAMN04488072_10250 [Lentibacillus halodurans]
MQAVRQDVAHLGCGRTGRANAGGDMAKNAAAALHRTKKNVFRHGYTCHPSITVSAAPFVHQRKALYSYQKQAQLAHFQ